MNILNIPKQADHELIYSKHAIERACERDVPMPKYLPFGTKFVASRYVKEQLRYKLSYKYNDAEYFIVLSENTNVMTVYPSDEISSKIEKIKKKMNADMVVSDEYICMDYEVAS